MTETEPGKNPLAVADSDTPNPDRRAKSWYRRFSIACLVTLAGVLGPLLFLLVMTLVEALEPGYNPVQSTISQLVFGPYGWIQTWLFFVFGVLLIVFVLRLYVAIPKNKMVILGIAFLFFTAIGFFLVGAFPTAPPGVKDPPLYAHIHGVVAKLQTVLFPFICFLVAPGMKADSRWRGFYIYTLATGVIGFILLIPGLMPESERWSGLQERILMLNGFIWIEAGASHLLQLGIREHRTNAGG